ncbi:DEAD-domain-containing protein [Neoconidiobolus thromboides FSU 785]|nr:DEAD-domain-containing protein [Neoconidiobolus thromboides FSU 785]
MPAVKAIRYNALPWKKVETSEALTISDDMGDVLGFEEIEGVDCEWVEDKNGGKTLQFKVIDEKKLKKNNNKAKKDEYELPLSIEEMKKVEFIHVNDFVETEAGDEVKKERKNKRPLVLRPLSDSEEEGIQEIENTEEDIIEEEEDIEEDIDEDTESDEEDIEEDIEGDEEEAIEGGNESDNEKESDGDFNFGDLEKKMIEKKEKKEKKAKTIINDKENKEAEFKFVPGDSTKHWNEYNLNERILKAIQDQGFESPTEIQKRVMPQAMKGKDIIGCAETGSGKTLAFGLPILNKLAYMDNSLEKNQKLFALILSPTRELAIQIKDHLKAMTKYARIKVDAIVGGMSIQKQERILNHIPHILVATPGRLWELITQSNFNKNLVQNIKFLVLDEADRMIEKGHFKELQYILDLVNKSNTNYQSFIFSATMDGNTSNPNFKSKKPKESVIDAIIKKIKFKDSNPVHIDITSKKITSEKLIEARIDCIKEEKDLYLYFFVTRYPGRTLVFLNSIDSIRRIVPILKNLNVNAYPLHAQMPQRQRLKNVDRFKNEENVVLICSDVAARGLDIPNVEYIVHYQIPRSGEIYIHRSGRTARAKRQGMSLMLCCPEELKAYRNICKALKRANIQEFPVDSLLASKLKARLALAKQVDQLQHGLDKDKADKSWLKKSADLLEIELDSDNLSSDEDVSKIKNKKKQGQLEKLKYQLKELLKEPILGLGYSSKYLSSNGNELVNTLNNNLNDDSLVFKGHKKTSALNLFK